MTNAFKYSVLVRDHGLCVLPSTSVSLALTSSDAEPAFLLDPVERQSARKSRYIEVAGSCAIGDRFNDARRNKRQWRQKADVTNDLALMERNRLERLDPTLD